MAGVDEFEIFQPRQHLEGNPASGTRTGAKAGQQEAMPQVLTRRQALLTRAAPTAVLAPTRKAKGQASGDGAHKASTFSFPSIGSGKAASGEEEVEMGQEREDGQGQAAGAGSQPEGRDPRAASSSKPTGTPKLVVLED